MSGKKSIEGAKEAIAVAKGDIPAARIHVHGHAYVPEAQVTEAIAQLQNALKAAEALDKWHRYGEGYGTLVTDVRAVIEGLSR